MGLTNIAGMSESARKRIIKEKGLPLIENYMFEHHDMIRRAAIQVCGGGMGVEGLCFWGVGQNKWYCYGVGLNGVG